MANRPAKAEATTGIGGETFARTGAGYKNQDRLGLARHWPQIGNPMDDNEHIEVNAPFERIPQCACDTGSGLPPIKQQKLECRLQGGPCRTTACIRARMEGE